MLDEGGQAKRFRLLDGMTEDAEVTDHDLAMLMNGDSRRSDASGLPNLLLRLDAGGWHRNKISPANTPGKYI